MPIEKKRSEYYNYMQHMDKSSRDGSLTKMIQNAKEAVTKPMNAEEFCFGCIRKST